MRVVTVSCSDQGALAQLPQLCQQATQRAQHLQQGLQKLLTSGADACEGSGSQQWQQLVQDVSGAMGRMLQEMQALDAVYQQVRASLAHGVCTRFVLDLTQQLHAVACMGRTQYNCCITNQVGSVQHDLASCLTGHLASNRLKTRVCLLAFHCPLSIHCLDPQELSVWAGGTNTQQQRQQQALAQQQPQQPWGDLRTGSGSVVSAEATGLLARNLMAAYAELQSVLEAVGTIMMQHQALKVGCPPV